MYKNHASCLALLATLGLLASCQCVTKARKPTTHGDFGARKVVLLRPITQQESDLNTDLHIQRLQSELPQILRSRYPDVSIITEEEMLKVQEQQAAFIEAPELYDTPPNLNFLAPEAALTGRIDFDYEVDVTELGGGFIKALLTLFFGRSEREKYEELGFLNEAHLAAHLKLELTDLASNASLASFQYTATAEQEQAMKGKDDTPSFNESAILAESIDLLLGALRRTLQPAPGVPYGAKESGAPPS